MQRSWCAGGGRQVRGCCVFLGPSEMGPGMSHCFVQAATHAGGQEKGKQSKRVGSLGEQ